VRRETYSYLLIINIHYISIHSLREKGDYINVEYSLLTYDISIHSLREKGDIMTDIEIDNLYNFNPLPS